MPSAFPIQVKELKVVKDKTILDGVNVDIPYGQLTVIMGPNGSGKTTLMRSMVGLEASAIGQTAFDGRLITEYSQGQVSKLLTWVPQGIEIPFRITVMEMIVLGRFPHHRGFPTYADRGIAMSNLETMGMIEFADRPVNELSAGEKHRVQIARALAQETPFIFLDEPCAHLDIGASMALLRTLGELAPAKRAILISMHDLFLTKEFAHKVALLDAGRLIGFGSPDEIMEASVLRKIYKLDSSGGGAPLFKYLGIKDD